MSILSLLKIEDKKLKHKHICLLMLSMLALEIFWIIFNFRDPDQWSGMEYSAMLFTIPQMIIIFFPLSIAIMASRLCDIEHKGNNLKLIRTLEPAKTLYITKILAGFKYLILITLPQFAVIFVLGFYHNFKEHIPFTHILFFTIEVLVISICVFMIQLFLSIFIENQMIALIVGLTGSFTGLFSLFVPKLSSYTIWGYYSILSPVSFWWDSDTRIVEVTLTPCNWMLLLLFTGIAFILYISGKWFFIRKEA